MHTEDDLRIALLDFVERSEPDEHAVRVEVERRITDSPRLIIPRGRWTVLASVAACIAVAIAIALGVHFSGLHSTTPPATKTSPPTVFGGRLYPGGKVVAEFEGTGSRKLQLGQYAVPAGSELVVEVQCHGKGWVAIEHLFSAPCSDTASAGRSVQPDTRTLQLTVGAATTWKVALVVQPNPRMNGSVGYPDSVFSDGSSADPASLGAGSGRGDGTVTLRPASPRQGYQIWLRCTGHGVTITSTSKSVKNDYTKTCFEGWDYQWDVARGTVPTKLTVTASTRTSWEIIVLPTPS